MSDTTAIISACLILMSLYTTFHLGIECERERARKARRRRYNEEDTE
jgi:hypothetical protein